MTLRTPIVTAGALLALIAPAAAGARAVTNLYADAAVSVANANHSLKSSAHKVSKKQSGTSRVGVSRFIYVPPYATAPDS